MNRDSAQKLVDKILQSNSLIINDSHFKVERLLTKRSEVTIFNNCCIPSVSNPIFDTTSFLSFVPYCHRLFFSIDLTNQSQNVLFKGCIGNPTKLFKCSSTPNSKYLTSDHSRFYPLLSYNSQLIDANSTQDIDGKITSTVCELISKGSNQDEKYLIAFDWFCNVLDATRKLIEARDELISDALDSTVHKISLQYSLLKVLEATTSLMFGYEAEIGSEYNFNKIQLKPGYSPSLANAELVIGSKNLDRNCYLMVELKKTIDGLTEKVNVTDVTRWKLNIEETFQQMYNQATNSENLTKTSLEDFNSCIRQISSYILFHTTLSGMITDGNTWLLLNFNTEYYDKNLRININPAVEKMVHSQEFKELAQMKQSVNNVTDNEIESHLKETILDGFNIVENLNNPSLEVISLKPLKMILLDKCLEIAQSNHNDLDNIVIELQVWMGEHRIFEQIDQIPVIPINFCGNYLGQSNIQTLFASIIHTSSIQTEQTDLKDYLRKLETMFAPIYGKPFSTALSTINSSSSFKSSSGETGLTSYGSVSLKSQNSAKRRRVSNKTVEMMDKIDEKSEDIDCPELQWLDFSEDPLATILQGERRISLEEIFGEPISYGPAQVFIIEKERLLSLFSIFRDHSNLLPDKMILKLYDEPSLTSYVLDAYRCCQICIEGRHVIPNIVADVLEKSKIEAKCLKDCYQYNLDNKNSPIKTSRLFGFGKFKFFNWDYGFPDFEGQFLLTEYIQPDEGGQLEHLQKKLIECKDVDERKKIKSYLDSLYDEAVDIVEKLKSIGINHNDLRRSNFIIHNNQVSIIDFGNAILKDSEYKFKKKLRMVFTRE